MRNRCPAEQDEFQKQFWKLRAAEYEPYTVQYLPLKIKQARRGACCWAAGLLPGEMNPNPGSSVGGQTAR